MASSRPPLLDLEITIVSAKHLQNVNWRNGDLQPYVVFWVDPDRKLATRPDDSGSTRPVWNERFTLPLTLPLQDSILTVEIFHSKPSETLKPLVGAVRSPLKDLIDSDDSNRVKTLELCRPSGRPQGKIRLKFAIRERPAPPPPAPKYQITPPSGYYYSTAPLPPPSRDYGGGLYGNPLPPPQSQYPYPNYASDPYPGYYPGYYLPSTPPSPRPFLDRSSNHGGGPSAPVDFSSSYDQKPKGSKMGFGTGLAVGAVAGAFGVMALDEGLKYEEAKIAERAESDIAAREDYSGYRSEY